MSKLPAWLTRPRVAAALLVLLGAGVAAVYTLNRPAAPVADRISPKLEQAVVIGANQIPPKLEQAA